MKLRRPHRAGQRGQLTLGRPAPDHQGTVQPLAQIGEALEHELGPGAGGVTAVEQAVVEAEDGHHPPGRVERRSQRRVIVHAQIACEPNEGGHRAD